MGLKIGFTKLNWVSLDHTELNLVLSRYALSWILELNLKMGFAGLYWVLLGFTGFYTDLGT